MLTPLERAYLRVTGEALGWGRTCTHLRAFSLRLLMPEVHVKTSVFYAWKAGWQAFFCPEFPRGGGRYLSFMI